MARKDNRVAQGKRRTQAKRSEEMQLRIKQAAFEVVAEGGLSALRIASVAKRAEVSQGAVLHHFPNKNEITLAAIEHALELANAESVVRDLVTVELNEILSAMITEFRSFFFSDRFWVAIGITIEFDRSDHGASMLSQEVSKLRSPIYELWERHLASVGWPESKSRKLVRSCAALVSGISIRNLWTPPDDIADEILFDWLTDALSSHPGADT